MKILNKAAQEAHIARLTPKANAQRYSQYPVHEAEFWSVVFNAAKSSKTAQKVLDEISQIEDEPCIENERVWKNVKTAKTLARLALMN